jgi:hypothetical protein
VDIHRSSLRSSTYPRRSPRAASTTLQIGMVGLLGGIGNLRRQVGSVIGFGLARLGTRPQEDRPSSANLFVAPWNSTLLAGTRI